MCCGETDCSENEEVLKSIYFFHVEKFLYGSKFVPYFINYLGIFIVAKTTFHHVRLTNNLGLSLHSTDWKSTLKLFNERL